MTMNPLSSKVHFLAQTRPKKRRTNRTGQTENQHERVNSAPKSRACADVIQLCRLRRIPDSHLSYGSVSQGLGTTKLMNLIR